MKVAIAVIVSGVVSGALLAASATAAIKLPKQCLAAAKVICVSKTDRKVRLVEHGKIVLALWARFGDSRPEIRYRTREGLCKVDSKEIRSWSNAYSVVMPFSLYFCGGHSQAIHYSYSFASDGYGPPSYASHGCVNTRDWDKMERLFNSVSEGTPVYVYR